MNDMSKTDLNNNDLSLTVKRRISAPMEKVYQAWLDPAPLQGERHRVQSDDSRSRSACRR